jgi:anti-sigma factor RsiW
MMHLDDFDIARYLDGVVTGAEKQQFEAHLSDCAVCAASLASAYRMMEALEAEAMAPTPTAAAMSKAERIVPSASRPALRLVRQSTFRWVAAAVVVMGLAVVAYFQMNQPDAARFRTGQADAGFVTTTPEEGATVEVATLQFVWESLDGTDAYWVTVYTAEGVVRWKDYTKAVSLALPDSILLEPGATYLWNVEAVQQDGTTIRTDLHAFTLAPKQETP